MSTPKRDDDELLLSFTWYDIVAGSLLVAWCLAGSMSWELKLLAWVWFLERDRLCE